MPEARRRLLSRFSKAGGSPEKDLTEIFTDFLGFPRISMDFEGVPSLAEAHGGF